LVCELRERGYNVFYLPNLEADFEDVTKAVIEMLEIEDPFILDILEGGRDEEEIKNRVEGMENLTDYDKGREINWLKKIRQACVAENIRNLIRWIKEWAKRFLI